MSDPITRLNAALEGRYRIESELGEGGMATVYLADDIKHERKVALKVLKPELAAVVGAERFLAEIKTTANLTHPHILPLHDSGKADEFVFYVMPYVEGESLRDRLNRDHQLPVDDAVRIATNVAEALDYAHRHSVIHRDIKPANILLQDGKPVISDFGIALAVGTAGQGRLTETGLSLGTPFYMSPEQATGDQHVGPSTDTYALGAVLYEMLTGDPPYMGSTAQAVLGQIIAGEGVSARKKRGSVPENVDAALRCALDKLPADRFRSAQDFARALENEHFRYGESAVAHGGGVATGPWKRRTMTFAALAALFAGVAAWGWLPPTPATPVTRLTIALAEGQEMETQSNRSRLAISPDGSFFVYSGPAPNGGWQLWRRTFEDLSATPIPETEFGYNPFFSPDGQRLGFTIGQMTLRVVSLAGGLPVTVADSVVGSAGVTWGPDDYLYADGVGAVPLQRVRPVAGSTPEPVSTLDGDRGETNHLWPEALPNGRGILFTVDYGGNNAQDVAVLDLEEGTHTILTRGAYPRFSPSGHVIYVTSDGTLMAARFDQGRLRFTSDPVAIVGDLELRAGGAADVTISHNGTLLYTKRTESFPPNELVWVERDGSATLIEPVQGRFHRPSISPDGTRIAVDQGDIWIKELPDGAFHQLTSLGGNGPAWSPDGLSIAFSSRRVAISDLFVVSADGLTEPKLLQDGEGVMQWVSFSPDGGWFVYGEDGSVYASQVGADVANRVSVVRGMGDGVGLSISPNGRWIAYESAAAGVSELSVAPSPFSDASTPTLPVGPGSFPVWGSTGEELFYRSASGTMVVRSVSDQESLVLGPPEELFSMIGYVGGFDVDSDGRRFAMVRQPPGARPIANLVVVQNFFEVLNRLVPN